MRFDLSSPLGMGKVTGKYMRAGYGNMESQTRLDPALLTCLVRLLSTNHEACEVG